MDSFIRLHHCHKVKQNVKIYEDYDHINGEKILIRSKCSYCYEKTSGYNCNGLNTYNEPCIYNSFIKK